MLDHLIDTFQQIQDMIQEHSDMPDFHEHCQKILKANSGMDFRGFFEMITCIVKARILRIQNSEGKPMDMLGLQTALSAIRKLRDHDLVTKQASHQLIQAIQIMIESNPQITQE